MSLRVDHGESVAIVGKSGSGKSTLMHLLALLDQPDDGTLRVGGVDAATLSSRQLSRLRNETFGFVFQQFFLNPNASVLENVILPLKIAGVGRRERRVRGMAVLDQLEMADKAKSKAVSLSGGQKQRAVIARALVNNPKLIFADEPTGNLDTVTGRLVEDILFRLNSESGITLVVVTHDSRTRCALRPPDLHQRWPRSTSRTDRSIRMKITDMLTTAVGNTLRSKTRTTLTVLAIFIGAFTLTITSAIGTGVSDYIDNQIGAFGAKDVLTITKASEETAQQEGPAEYDPDAGIVGADLTQFETEPLTEDDLDAIRRVEGILDVSAVRQVNPRYIEYDHSGKYMLDVNASANLTTPDLASGAQLDNAGANPQILLVTSYVDALGFRGCGQRGRRDSADRDRRLHRSACTRSSPRSQVCRTRRSWPPVPR